MDDAFHQQMLDGYAVPGPSLVLGAPMKDNEVATDVRVQVGLPMTNRHGLIAGATGTGKTKTLQIMAGQLSDAGVPVFISDVKGDLTGMAALGDPANPNVVSRCASIGWTFVPRSHPVDYVSLSGKLGAQVRASVHSFGPMLLGKVLGLNDTQTSVLSVIFKYCDDNSYPLLDLADLRTTLQYLSSDDGKGNLETYGGMSPATVGVILRSLITLEQEGADVFFGEPAFDVHDLMRLTPDGKGVVSMLELSDVMDKPALFSTFMLWMLAQLYQALPEAGDLPQPKLAFFFDEAHLLFRDASQALLDQVELTVRLIRSKGVGVYFVTQTPTDVPSPVLAQLGNRVQHALRAFTPNDADDLRKTARTFPMTTFYNVETTITSLGIGEALVTVLSPKGVPTPLAATRLIPPDSLMAPLAADAFAASVATSMLRAKYAQTIDRDSAHEMIERRIAAAHAAAAQAAAAAAGVPGAAGQVPGYGGGATTTSWGAPVPPVAGATTDTGLNTMTPAQQRAEIRRQVAAQNRANREAERLKKQQAREAKAAETARKKRDATLIREGSRVIRSRAGQSVVRGVLGVLFGSGRR